ncbi:MAG: SMP-30/gluconolactonase/LRE family protein [Casimicrobiaceae bacterium]
MTIEWTTLPVNIDLLGECPTWDTATHTLYWSDIPGKALKSWNPDSGEHRVWPMPAEVGCFALRRQGGAILALRTGYALFDFTTKAMQTLPSPNYDQKVMRFNDGRAGPDGRFYAGTMYEPRGNAEGRLYRLDTDMTWTELADTAATVSNGLAFSPDGRTLYRSDTATATISSHAFDVASGSIGPRRTFATIPPPEQAEGAELGRPDGATIDAEGCYWSAMYGGKRLVRYAPDGTIEREIAFPVRCPTMVCFGGENLDLLFVTTSRNGRSAIELAAQPDAGRVFVAKMDVRGRAEPKFNG